MRLNWLVYGGFLAVGACAVQDADDDGATIVDCAEAMTATECAGVESTPERQCVWAEVTPVSSPQCAISPVEGRCVSTAYQGEGCQLSQDCGMDSGGQVFYRELPDGSFEFLRHPTLCEYYPEGWDQCAWDQDTQLLAGDPKCDCICDFVD